MGRESIADVRAKLNEERDSRVRLERVLSDLVSGRKPNHVARASDGTEFHLYRPAHFEGGDVLVRWKDGKDNLRGHVFRTDNVPTYFAPSDEGKGIVEGLVQVRDAAVAEFKALSEALGA